MSRIELVGVASLPEPAGRPYLDLDVAAWPFSVNVEHQATLCRLDYQAVDGSHDPSQQRRLHEAGDRPFKSRNTNDRGRPTDEADFEVALPRLASERRAWLRWARVATQREHPWIAR